MTFSWRRVNAILIKDYKDFSRNLAVSAVIFMVPIMAAIFGRMGVTTIAAHYMVFNMAFSMVATYVQTSLIAEEKEKNTLRGLMLSPASTLEILFGKSLLTFIMTMLVLVFSAYFGDYRPQNILVIAVAFALSAIFYIGIGTLLGLFSKSVMEASVLVLPVIGVFSFGSFVTPFAEKYPILKVMDYFPNVQLIDLATKVEAGAGFGESLVNFGIIFVWVIVIFALTVVIYRKRMVD